jgi:hypothetical protein
VGRQLLNEFITGKWPPVRQDIADDAEPASAGVLIQTQFLTPSPTCRNKHRTKER